MDSDPRQETYTDFQDSQHEREIPKLKVAADRVLRILFEHVPRAESVLDVGCGFGAWLAAAKELGVTDLHGIDGPWLVRNRVIVGPDRVEILDLEKPFTLGRRFDLVMCIEVAEHISEASADSLITSLTDHGDLVLFSAAIPYQGGHHHVNERFPDYWAEKFAACGFEPIDLIRRRIWDDVKVPPYLRQNLLLFANSAALEKHSTLAAHREGDLLLSIVHPLIFVNAARRAYESRNLMNLLSQPGVYRIAPGAGGKLSVERVDPNAQM